MREVFTGSAPAPKEGLPGILGRIPKEGLSGFPWMAPKGGLPELPAWLLWLPELMDASLATCSPSNLSHTDQDVGRPRFFQILKTLSVQKRGERKFPFPTIPRNTSLKFPFTSHWKIPFPFPKSGNAISNFPSRSREKKFPAGNWDGKCILYSLVFPTSYVKLIHDNFHYII